MPRTRGLLVEPQKPFKEVQPRVVTVESPELRNKDTAFSAAKTDPAGCGGSMGAVIPTLGRLRQDNYAFELILGFTG